MSDVGAALVVDDDVRALGPVGLFIDRVQMLRAGVGIVGDGPFDFGTS